MFSILVAVFAIRRHTGLKFLLKNVLFENAFGELFHYSRYKLFI